MLVEGPKFNPMAVSNVRETVPSVAAKPPVVSVALTGVIWNTLPAASAAYSLPLNGVSE